MGRWTLDERIFADRNKTHKLPYAWFKSIMKKVEVYVAKQNQGLKKGIDKEILNDIMV